MANICRYNGANSAVVVVGGANASDATRTVSGVVIAAHHTLGHALMARSWRQITLLKKSTQARFDSPRQLLLDVDADVAATVDKAFANQGATSGFDARNFGFDDGDRHFINRELTSRAGHRIKTKLHAAIVVGEFDRQVIDWCTGCPACRTAIDGPANVNDALFRFVAANLALVARQIGHGAAAISVDFTFKPGVIGFICARTKRSERNGRNNRGPLKSSLHTADVSRVDARRNAVNERKLDWCKSKQSL
jgi:hypothetical protein